MKETLKIVGITNLILLVVCYLSGAFIMLDTDISNWHMYSTIDGRSGLVIIFIIVNLLILLFNYLTKD